MKPEREILCAIALNKIPGVGSVTYRKLIENFGSAEGAFRAGGNKLEFIKGIKKDSIEAIARCDPEKDGIEEWEKANRAGFGLICLGSPEYPVRLAEIPDPPPVLYVAGQLQEGDEVAVAVVGSRDPTDYGRRITGKITADMARAGVTIVSGMARGIDSAAHRAALDAGGRTVAVLGSGLDVVYPRENVPLFEAIRKNGAVISSFPMGTRPEKGNFPARNRIISGMSLGVIVVQATTMDSGGLITAGLANEQGREVFAVPGNVDSLTSRGTNALIKKGEAKLTENAADVLEEILPQLRIPQKGQGKDAAPKSAPAPKLEGVEQNVFEKVGDEPMHIDIIARKCNIPVHELAGVLLSLELKGLVSQQPGMNYARSPWNGGD